MRTFTGEQVFELLSMQDCIDAMDIAMRASSRGDVVTPQRTHIPLIDATGVLLAMPGSANRYYGAKIVGIKDDNAAKGLPVVQGVVILFDHDTGTPVALVDGAAVTALRTAAASGLATRELARSDARTHGIIGTGVQAASHIDAIGCVREIKEVRVWGRDFAKAQAFASSTAGNVVAVIDIADAAGCDVVSTVTASPDPVLKAQDVAAGAHVNLVGAHTPATREADSELMARSRIYVDAMASALNEAGDILIPIGEGVISTDAVVGEIGHVLNGDVPARVSAEEITVYKSLGVVAQDLFAAARVFEYSVS